jgi:hypothetical protein
MMQRPSINEVRFTTITRKRFTWEESQPSGKMLDSVRFCDVDNDELSYEWNRAMDAFTPWVRELMTLDTAWEMAQVESISVAWQWSGDDWLMKINSIVVSRECLSGEVPMERKVKTGKITEEGFEVDTKDLLSDLWNESWKYYTSRPEQLSLLENPGSSVTATRSKAPGLRLVS